MGGVVREGFPEEATFKLRPEGRVGWGERTSGCWEGLDERTVVGNFQQPQGAQVLLRARRASSR